MMFYLILYEKSNFHLKITFSTSICYKQIQEVYWMLETMSIQSLDTGTKVKVTIDFSKLSILNHKNE